MFYIGTKIVVIGSNIKRKAGPRVGSIGFVISFQNQDFFQIIENGNFIVREALVLFTNYGFQKQTRFEVKKVYFIVPNIRRVHISSTEKNLNKDIREVRKYLSNCPQHKHAILLVSPANNLDTNCLTGKVASCLLNNQINYKISRIINNISSKDFPNADRLYNLLSEETRKFLSKFIHCSNINSIYTLLYSTEKKILEETLQLIIKLDVLNVLAERTNCTIRKNINVETQMFNSLFKPFDFKNKTLIWRRHVPVNIINYCISLRDFICNESSKILKKHF